MFPVTIIVQYNVKCQFCGTVMVNVLHTHKITLQLSTMHSEIWAEAFLHVSITKINVSLALSV